MTKEELIQTVSKCSGTVLSFPDRGADFGQNSYRGNCSGFIPAYFLWRFNSKSCCEVFAGGGTTSDVCKCMGIPYIGIDLNPVPVRSDIISMDILDMNRDLPNGFYRSDFAFIHPPYPTINGVRYSTGMWKQNATPDLISRDIQEMDWEHGMEAVNKAILRTYEALKSGAYMAVLVGDVRSNGQYHSMIADMIRPTKLHQMYVKLQHNTVSDRSGNTYSRSDRALTEHEMIAVFKKPDSGYQMAIVLPKEYKVDIRDTENSTWKDVISAVMRKLGEATLGEIYSEVEGCRKAAANPNWKAKVRQVLQQAGIYRPTARGCWSMAA